LGNEDAGICQFLGMIVFVQLFVGLLNFTFTSVVQAIPELSTGTVVDESVLVKVKVSKQNHRFHVRL